jgi:Fibronectin type III domain
VDPLGERIAVGVVCNDPRILVLDAATGSKAAQVSAAPREIAFGPTGESIYESTWYGGANGYQLRRATPKAPVSAPPKPARASSVAVSLRGTSATVKWRAPRNAKQAKVSAYRVTSRPATRTCRTLKVRACTFSGLVRGRTDVFIVEARGAAGWGPRSLSSVVSVPVLTPPEPPTPQPTPTPTPSPKPSQPLT